MSPTADTPPDPHATPPPLVVRDRAGQRALLYLAAADFGDGFTLDRTVPYVMGYDSEDVIDAGTAWLLYVTASARTVPQPTELSPAVQELINVARTPGLTGPAARQAVSSTLAGMQRRQYETFARELLKACARYALDEVSRAYAVESGDA